ncbi:outer membrane protein [Taklimakanibacter lacteus]|uniref:outer membrane protein n=1 Tax=Taklimakanibacter lacteus TaxID=2268456 RepID=UPI000E66EF15
MINKLLLAGAVSAFVISSAQAADFVEEPAVYDWSGPYIGAHFGYGGVGTDGEFDRDADVNNDLSDFDAEGILGGAQLGWNWQSGDWVFGIEGDISAVDWDSSAEDQIFAPGEVTLEIDFLATIRGRVGWAMDNTLLYVTGGVAFLEGEFEDTEEGGSADVSATGGAIGGGLEWGMTENLSIKAEGLYLFFDDDTSLADLPTGASTDSLEIEDGYIVRLGANLRF